MAGKQTVDSPSPRRRDGDQKKEGEKSPLRLGQRPEKNLGTGRTVSTGAPWQSTKRGKTVVARNGKKLRKKNLRCLQKSTPKRGTVEKKTTGQERALWKSGTLPLDHRKGAATRRSSKKEQSKKEGKPEKIPPTGGNTPTRGGWEKRRKHPPPPPPPPPTRIREVVGNRKRWKKGDNRQYPEVGVVTGETSTKKSHYNSYLLSNPPQKKVLPQKDHYPGGGRTRRSVKLETGGQPGTEPKKMKKKGHL